MEQKEWDGRAVKVSPPGLGQIFERRPYVIALTEQAMRELALSLGRLKQTTVGMPDNMHELLDGINFLLVGDPDSRAAHRRMEAGKGMTPDGGHRQPDHSPGAASQLPGIVCNDPSHREAGCPHGG